MRNDPCTVLTPAQSTLTATTRPSEWISQHADEPTPLLSENELSFLARTEPRDDRRELSSSNIKQITVVRILTPNLSFFPISDLFVCHIVTKFCWKCGVYIINWRGWGGGEWVHSFTTVFLFLSRHVDLIASTTFRQLFVWVSVCEGINFISISRE